MFHTSEWSAYWVLSAVVLVVTKCQLVNRITTTHCTVLRLDPNNYLHGSKLFNLQSTSPTEMNETAVIKNDASMSTLFPNHLPARMYMYHAYSKKIYIILYIMVTYYVPVYKQWSLYIRTLNNWDTFYCIHLH